MRNNAKYERMQQALSKVEFHSARCLFRTERIQDSECRSLGRMHIAKRNISR